MFPTQSKAHRFSPLWLLPMIALALLLAAYLLFAASTAQAQTPAGEYCIEGIVIDWEEKPLAGITVTLESDLLQAPLTAVSKDKDDKGKFSFKDLPGRAGIYTATVALLPGWEGVTPTSISFPINVGEKSCVKIRFKLRYIVPVTVYKFDTDHVGLEDWKIKAVPGKGNIFAEVIEKTTDVSGTAVFSLTPGAWIFVEHPPTADKDDIRETYRPVLPPTAAQEVKISRDDTGLEVFFKNELVTGCILIRKLAWTDGDLIDDDDPGGAPGNGQFVGSYPAAGWGFALLRTDGSLARKGVTDARGEIRFDGLPLGPYVLVEEDRPGWSEFFARELDVNVTGNLCNDANAIYFDNYQDDSGFCIEGRKIDSNGGYGVPGWKIKIKPLDKGGYDPADVTTDGLGKYRVDFPLRDYRIPGGKFEVCEEEKDGWVAETPTCQTVRLPEWPGACVQLKDFVNKQVRYEDKGGDHCSAYHVVKPGEGLYDIAKKYGVSASAMLNANPVVKKHPHQWVFIGQKLCIP